MLNFHRTNGFRVSIDRLPNFTFTTQQVQVPGINLAPVAVPTPFATMKAPGDVLMFESIQITYPLLEDFSNYIEIYHWMVGLGFPQTRKQFEYIFKEGETSRITILALDSEENIVMEFVYHNAFPTSLSALPLDVAVSTQDPVMVTATFDYTYFDLNLEIDNVK